MAGIELELKTCASEEEMEAFAPLSKGLVLKVCRPGECPPQGGQEAVTQSNAILRTLAAARPDALLYGRTEFESAQVCVGGVRCVWCSYGSTVLTGWPKEDVSLQQAQ